MFEETFISCIPVKHSDWSFPGLCVNHTLCEWLRLPAVTSTVELEELTFVRGQMCAGFLATREQYIASDVHRFIFLLLFCSSSISSSTPFLISPRPLHFI